VASRLLEASRFAGARSGLGSQRIVRGSAVTRTNVLYLIIGALVIAVAALGYELYQARKAPPEGVHIDIGPKGLSIEKK
jgi:hypothetical protein